MGNSQDSIDKLLIGGVFTTRARLFDEAPEQGQEILQAARTNNRDVMCICLGNAHPIPMSLALRERRFYLRRMPRQGGEHHKLCVSYGGINGHAQQIYADEAIREDGDKIAIRLDAPISELQKEGFRLEKGGEGRAATPSVRRSAMSMLGLLNYLWEEADLNKWWPAMEGKRNASVLRHYLLEACKDRVVGKGVDLSRIVFIPQPSRGAGVNNEAELEAHLRAVASMRGAGETCYGIVIGEVSKIIAPGDSNKSSGIVLNHLFKKPLWDNHSVVKRLEKSFGPAMTRLAERQRAKDEHLRRVRQQNEAGAPNASVSRPALPNPYSMIGIFAVALSPSGSFVVKHGAVMETSPRFIPVASHYEGLVEAKLHQEKRAFVKPMVYDGERSFFPDFQLLDTGLDPVPVLEVYGYSGDEYEERKREKHVGYVRDRVPYWYWDVKASPAVIPSFDRFPKVARRRP